MNNNEFLDIAFKIADFTMTKLVYIIPWLILLVPSLIAFVKSSITLIKRLKNFEETEATIIEFYNSVSNNNGRSRSYFAKLSYKVENKVYIHKYSLGLNGKKIGDKMTIFYNKKDPNEVRFKFLTFFNPIISCLFLSLSIYFAISMLSEMP